MRAPLRRRWELADIRHRAGEGEVEMWSTETIWFDVAVVMSIFAVGTILFGRFEEHKPRGRRLAKVAVVLVVTLVLSRQAGRVWAYAVLSVPLAVAVWVHLVWLPRHGVSGWTAEPRERYLELVSRRDTAGR